MSHFFTVSHETQLIVIRVQPIRTPGAVQAFGVLIAVQEVDDTLIVRQVSEVYQSFFISCQPTTGPYLLPLSINIEFLGIIRNAASFSLWSRVLYRHPVRLTGRCAMG